MKYLQLCSLLPSTILTVSNLRKINEMQFGQLLDAQFMFLPLLTYMQICSYGSSSSFDLMVSFDKLQSQPHLLKKFSTKNFIFCAVLDPTLTQIVIFNAIVITFIPFTRDEYSKSNLHKKKHHVRSENNHIKINSLKLNF